MKLSDIQNMSDNEFRRLVDSEVRGNSGSSVRSLLHDPSIDKRWYFTLLTMKKSVESQLGAKRADLATRVNNPDYESDKIEYFTWRGGALRFKNGVEDRLLEIRKDWDAAHEKLIAAIRVHKDSVLDEFPDEVSSADESLWEHLTS